MLKRWTTMALGLLILGGCASGAVTPGKTFRDVGQPLSVTTRGNGMTDMSGPWFIRAHFPNDGSAAMVTFLPEYQGGEAVEVRREGCNLSGDCEAEAYVLRAEALGQNRWRLSGDSRDGPDELWVIWVDDGFRTAAIGAPDGSYGWIIDRRAEGGADRVKAAADILAFNGYDVARMKAK